MMYGLPIPGRQSAVNEHRGATLAQSQACSGAVIFAGPAQSGPVGQTVPEVGNNFPFRVSWQIVIQFASAVPRNLVLKMTCARSNPNRPPRR